MYGPTRRWQTTCPWCGHKEEVLVVSGGSISDEQAIWLVHHWADRHGAIGLAEAVREIGRKCYPAWSDSQARARVVYLGQKYGPL